MNELSALKQFAWDSGIKNGRNDRLYKLDDLVAIYYYNEKSKVSYDILKFSREVEDCLGWNKRWVWRWTAQLFPEYATRKCAQVVKKYLSEVTITHCDVPSVFLRPKKDDIELVDIGKLLKQKTLQEILLELDRLQHKISQLQLRLAAPTA